MHRRRAQSGAAAPVATDTRGRSRSSRLGTAIAALFLLLLLAFGAQSSTISPAGWRQWGMAQIVQPWGFNLLAWEIDALWHKLRAFALQPAHGLDHDRSVQLVYAYLERAQTMRQLETSINEILTNTANSTELPSTLTVEIHELQAELDLLRLEQQQQRATVEQIIEAQIAHELQNDNLMLFGQPLPPVQFTFVEPPRKLVVSPRDEITTIYSRMLDAEMTLAEIEAAESAYRQEFDSSAYITNIGGLGAFPTMVVDRASLGWILSTVAHEWVHNYLTLFPLGFNYMTSHEFMTMNETVAEIVGNEMGERALRTFYPALVPPPDPYAATTAMDEPLQEPVFDFRVEMRATRLVVDELLAAGEVEEAETYMEERRRYFVENGYPLRVLNQAYFAFHGSYGTSAASSSPIGPKMEALRAATPDLSTFLQTVRSFTSVADLDAALASYGQ